MKLVESPSMSPSELSAFLAETGWSAVGSGAAGTTWVRTGDESAPAIQVPHESSDPSCDGLMQSALERLCWVLGEDESEIRRTIRSHVSDVLEVRVTDPTTASGRIALRRGARLAETLYEIVLNGLRVSRLGGRPWYGGPLPEGADDVLRQFELLPASSGSYRLEVVALSPRSLPGLPAPESDARTALRAALQAIEGAKGAATLDVPTDADELEGPVSMGMSTNLLEALTDLDTQSTQLAIEFTTRWASDSAGDNATTETVRLEPQHLARLPALTELLKQHMPRSDYVISGWIKTVSAAGIASEEQPLAGSVVIETKIDGKRRDVIVELIGSELKRAAAGLGEQFISAKGTLERIGRRWHLTGATQIDIGPTADSEPHGD
jgi:hypothetical protein